MALSVKDLLAKKKADTLKEQVQVLSHVGQAEIEHHKPFSNYVTLTDKDILIQEALLPGSTSPASQGAVPLSPADVLSTPSEAVTRDTMEDLNDKDLQDFKASIQNLHDSFENPSQIVNAVRYVLMGLREHPDFKGILKPEDLGAMVKGLRESHGLVAAIKHVNKDKKSESKKKSSEMDDLVSGIAGKLGIFK